MRRAIPLRAVLLALFTAAYLIPFVRVLWRVGDEGTMVYGAQRVAEGALPYRDFFVENAGPATFYLLALFFKVFGITWVTARGALLLTGVLTTVLVYWMTRRVYRGPFESVPAILVTLVGIPLWPATNHHWDSNLFALASVGAFFRWQETGRKWYLAAAGVLAGVTSCSIQQKGLLILLGLLISLVLVRKLAGVPQKFASHAGLLVGGYCGLGFLVLFLFLVAGGLPDLIHDTLIWPLSAYSRINEVPYGFGAENFWRSWHATLQPLMTPSAMRLVQLLLALPLLLILVLPMAVVALGITCWMSPRASRVFGPPMLPYWLAGTGLWISELHRKDWIHLVYGAPLLIIVAFLAWSIALENHGTWRKLTLVLFSISMYVFASYTTLVALSANKTMPTRRGTVYAFQDDGALRFLHEKVGPGENVFVYPYFSMYYFVAGVTNPTRHTVLVYNQNTDEQFQSAIAALEQKQVRYVLWDTVVENSNMKSWFPAYQPPPPERLKLEAYLSSHYEVLDIQNGFRILRRRANVRASVTIPAATVAYRQ